MAENDLRKLSRNELVEIIYQMKKNEEELKVKLDDAEAKLRDRSVKIGNAGSIAQAVLEINGVLAAAQRAADDYVAEIHSMYKDDEAHFSKMKMETEMICRKREAEADYQIREKWARFEKKTQDYIAANAELRMLMAR